MSKLIGVFMDLHYERANNYKFFNYFITLTHFILVKYPMLIKVIRQMLTDFLSLMVPLSFNFALVPCWLCSLKETVIEWNNIFCCFNWML